MTMNKKISYLVFWIDAQAKIDAHNVLEVHSLQNRPCHHHYNLASFDLIEDKMEKVPRGGNGLSARLGLAAAGEVGCAAVRAVVEHLSGQVA